MESITYRIKLKNKNFEFEVEGDKNFVEEYFAKAEDYLEMLSSYEDINLDTNKIHNIKNIEYNPESEDEGEISLDDYLAYFDVKPPQQLIIGLALYLVEIKNLPYFNSRDLNKILKENHTEPIDSISTHITRLVKKKLLSQVQREGKSKYTIYKNQVDAAKNFISKKSE